MRSNTRDGDLAGATTVGQGVRDVPTSVCEMAGAFWNSYCCWTRRGTVNFLQSVSRFIATPSDDSEETDDDVPPTSLRTKLVMAAVTFLSAFVATVTLQGYRHRKRTKDV